MRATLAGAKVWVLDGSSMDSVDKICRMFKD